MDFWDEIEVNDEMFDVDAVEAGAWVPGPYGLGDSRGTFNEVTPARTAAALARLDLSRPVKTYNLSEALFNDFPAHGDLAYQQRLAIAGLHPPAGTEAFKQQGGVVIQEETFGPNRMSVTEERVSLDYKMGTNISGLTHCGVGNMFYNGHRGPELARPWGVVALDTATMGAIVTRGVVADVVGFKVATGVGSDVFEAPNGRPVLNTGYRITVEDIVAALAWAGVRDPIGPGDVVLIRTGWRHLIGFDPDRYLTGIPPGPYLRECRYLARNRPALLGSDTWCFETTDPGVHGGHAMAAHQELLMRFGVRIGEAVPTCPLVDDGVYDFVFCFNPQRAKGAVSSNSPPLALANRPG